MNTSQSNPLCAVETCRIRLLVGFSLEIGQGGGEPLARVEDALANATNGTNLELGSWIRKFEFGAPSQPRQSVSGQMFIDKYYGDDYYAHPLRFLFSGAGATGCNYWQFSERAAELLNDCQLVHCSSRNQPADEVEFQQHLHQGAFPLRKKIRMADHSGIELIVSAVGTGVLSIGIEFNDSCTINDLQTINHALATGQVPVWISKPGFDNPKHTITDPNPTTFPQRLGQAKHAFQVTEWIDWLLSPLEKAGLILHREPRHFVYTTVHLPVHIDFAENKTHDDWQNDLARLAQIHPASHPGTVVDVAETLLINNKHLCSLSLAGAAHAVARQDPPEGNARNPYDEEQLLRAHVHYFVGYALALIQRLIVQRLLDVGGALLSEHTRNALPTEEQSPGGEHESTLQSKFTALRNRVLSFCLEGEFVLVSHRHTVQKFHERAQQVNLIEQGIESVRHSLNDWEIAKQAEQVTRSLHAIETMQNKIEWLEVFIVLVYVIEAGHILAVGFGWPHWWWLGLTLVLLSIAGGMIGYLTLRPHKHAPKETKRMKRLAFLLAGAFLLFATANCPWIYSKLGLEPPNHHTEEHESHAPHDREEGQHEADAPTSRHSAIDTGSEQSEPSIDPEAEQPNPERKLPEGDLQNSESEEPHPARPNGPEHHVPSDEEELPDTNPETAAFHPRGINQ